MRRTKIIYWIFTGIIFAFDSLIPALTSNTQVAIDGIHRLGFPDYFRVELTVFKVLGGLALILPIVPRRLKEWAYAGFAINFISAGVANWVVYGFGAFAVLPLVLVVMLGVSYITYNRISLGNAQARPGNQYAAA
ncbi:MAG: hypothetical protein BGO55_24715 [Sphingobacteriales bacterium 50-39]|nr:DoxX family protein [Sphingobacteriales bacterium]OJW58490.1 MAG: hypothetical protein BGO55_24715 [Sphingobacteriales bacterium 50-39]